MFPGSNISRENSYTQCHHIATYMWALATFSTKASDVNGKDPSFGLNQLQAIELFIMLYNDS